MKEEWSIAFNEGELLTIHWCVETLEQMAEEELPKRKGVGRKEALDQLAECRSVLAKVHLGLVNLEVGKFAATKAKKGRKK